MRRTWWPIFVLVGIGLAGCGEAEPRDPGDWHSIDDTSGVPTASKTDDSRGRIDAGLTAAPASGEDCESTGAVACIDDRNVLLCRQGYDGRRWVEGAHCTDVERCATDYGCAPLPTCRSGTDTVEISCVGRTVFECRDGRWSWDDECPAGIECVHGRGCPNDFGIAESCNPGEGVRCQGDEIQRCIPRGFEFGWAMPEPCPEDSFCLSGQGCVRDGGCRRLNYADCTSSTTARYCIEQADGVLGWTPEQRCPQQCTPDAGCYRPCRRRSWTGSCLD